MGVYLEDLLSEAGKGSTSRSTSLKTSDKRLGLIQSKGCGGGSGQIQIASLATQLLANGETFLAPLILILVDETCACEMRFGNGNANSRPQKATLNARPAMISTLDRPRNVLVPPSHQSRWRRHELSGQGWHRGRRSVTQAIPANDFFVGVLSGGPFDAVHTRIPCHSCMVTWRSRSDDDY